MNPVAGVMLWWMVVSGSVCASVVVVWGCGVILVSVLVQVCVSVVVVCPLVMGWGRGVRSSIGM